MRGTKVQWIYRHDWAAGVVRTSHRAGITQTYSPWAPLDSDHDDVSGSAQFIVGGLAAIESSPILRQDRAVVDFEAALAGGDDVEHHARVERRKRQRPRRRKFRTTVEDAVHPQKVERLTERIDGAPRTAHASVSARAVDSSIGVDERA
jgi:hypothetical protein